MEKPVKNYIILFVICLITIISVFYLRWWYNTTTEYYENNSIISNVLHKVNQDEITNYSVESPNLVLYASSGKNLKIKEFEKKFKKIIETQGLSDSIIYLDIQNIKINTFNKYMENNFGKNKKVNLYLEDEEDAKIYIFNNGTVKKVITNLDNIDANTIKNILVEEGMIEND